METQCSCQHYEFKEIVLKTVTVQEEKPRMLIGGGHSVQADVAGNGRIWGHRWIHLRTVQRGDFVSQDGVRQLIKSLDPEGAALRQRNYRNKSPGTPSHGDWCDMLKSSGVAINGCIDGSEVMLRGRRLTEPTTSPYDNTRLLHQSHNWSTVFG